MNPDPACFFAFDHRSVLRRICADALSCGVHSVGQGRLQQLKWLAVDGLLRDSTSEGGGIGLLIDEELGAEPARRAHAAGVVLAMPIEVSGAPQFRSEFGDEMLSHLQAFDVDYGKALVYINPGREDMYRAQLSAAAGALKAISDAGIGTMLEVVITPTPRQLALCDGIVRRFDREVRPALVSQTIEAFYLTGVKPTVWKLEGFDESEAYEQVQTEIFAHDRAARCLVLGRGLASGDVHRWLQLAAMHEAFCGFAVGRTIWRDPIIAFLTGKLDEEGLSAEIARRFTEMSNGFRQVRGGRRGTINDSAGSGPMG